MKLRIGFSGEYMTNQIVDNKDCVMPCEVASTLARTALPPKAHYNFVKIHRMCSTET